MLDIICRIENVFDVSCTSEEALDGIYKVFFPGIDLKTLARPLVCGNSAYRFLTANFHIFDFEKNGNPTGILWARQGFKPEETLNDWEVKTAPRKILACVQ